jgi:hypothetical protein
MAQTARKPSHNAWDDELRDRLTALARRGDTSGADVVRAGASYGASIVATDLDAHWRAAREDGPIDVIDMFSGCGGMSAGFRAVNGLVPAFRLAAAVDIDKVANGSYRANLGLTPMAESVAVLAKSAKLRERLTEARRPGHPLILIRVFLGLKPRPSGRLLGSVRTGARPRSQRA